MPDKAAEKALDERAAQEAEKAETAEASGVAQATKETAPAPQIDPNDVTQTNPQAFMKPLEKNTLEKEHINALASPGDYQVEEAWHRHYLNTNGQQADVNFGEKKIKAAEMLERVKRLLHTGKIKRALNSP